jgi:predicted  nucleic acid-binding Zn-ribbon protein
LEASRNDATPDPATLDEIAADYTASLAVFAPMIAEHQATMRSLRTQGDELRFKLAAEEQGNADRTAHIGEMERLVSEADARRTEAEVQFQTALNERLLHARALEVELEAMRERVAGLDAALLDHVATARSREAALAAQVQTRDARIGSLEAGVHKERGRVSALESQLRTRDAELQARGEDVRENLLEKQSELEAAESQLAGHVAALAHERSVSEQLRSDIDARDTATRAMLDTTHRAYQNSTSWKVTAPIRWFGAIGRKVRLLGANASTITQQVGGLSKTVERAHQIVKQEGIAGLTRRVENVVNRAAAVEAAPANTQLSILERNRPLEVIAAEWKTQTDGLPELSREQLVRNIATATKDTVYLSLTHDNYAKNFGGIQLCAQIEEAQARKAGQAYVNLHPVQPLPILSQERDGFRFAVVLNGASIGSCTVANLLGAIADLRADQRRVTVIVHSLLGHAPEIAAQLAEASGDEPAYFWLHDYLSVCPSYNLLRNNLTFCGAPAPQSNACAVCLHGEHRQSHIDRIKRFLQSANVMVLSPSDYALRLWRKALDLEVKAAIVPHVAFAAHATNGRTIGSGEPIRVAYLGLPSHHKGWSAFARLASEFGADPNYRFYHFGQLNSGLANVKFVPVKVSAGDRAAMTNAIAESEIDVAFIWSMWPETFCFTMYEALAGGASILTNPNSGNVQDTVRMSGEGVVLEDEPSLIQFFASGDLREHVKTQRARGRKQRNLLYSDMSFAPQVREPMA